MKLTPLFTIGAASSTAMPPVRALPFVMQYQQQDLWCWAATSVSVNLFFNPASPWEQCGVANQALNQTCCCRNGATTACDQPWYLEDALIIVGNFVSVANGRVAQAEAMTQIDSLRPLCLRIAWSTGGGH